MKCLQGEDINYSYFGISFYGKGLYYNCINILNTLQKDIKDQKWINLLKVPLTKFVNKNVLYKLNENFKIKFN